MKIRIVSTGNNRIELIKYLRQITELGVSDLYELVKDTPFTVEVKPEFEMKDIAYEFAVIGAIVQPIEDEVDTVKEDDSYDNKAESKEEYVFILERIRSNKLQIIKIIRKFTGFELKRCKIITEMETPTFTVSLTEEEFRRLKNEFLKQGIIANGYPANEVPEVSPIPEKSTVYKEQRQKPIETEHRKQENYRSGNEMGRKDFSYLKDHSKAYIKNNKNFSAATSAGVVASIISIVVWTLLFSLTGRFFMFFILIMAGAIGYAFRKYGKGSDSRFGKRAVIILFSSWIAYRLIVHLLIFHGLNIVSIHDVLFGFLFPGYHIWSWLFFIASFFLVYKLAVSKTQDKSAERVWEKDSKKSRDKNDVFMKVKKSRRDSWKARKKRENHRKKDLEERFKESKRDLDF